MRQHDIRVIGARVDEPSISAILDSCHLRGVASSPAEVGAPAALGEHGPVLIVVAPGTPLAGLFKLVDDLLQGLTPGVLLMDRVDDAARGLQGEGLIVLPRDADPRLAGAMLYALAERQAAVRSLCLELEVAARRQGGVHGEMSRIHEEMNLAALVQQELLPRELPTAEGFDFGVIFRPASYVSGDIYGLARLGEHRVGFFIADAVGHGVPAALMTMVISRCLRLEAESAFASPGAAMSRLNRELCRGDTGAPRFATAVHGTLDTRTRRVTLAVAGHPPPLRLLDGRATACRAEGPLLGIFPDEPFEEMTFELEPGETLLIYSDGFETAFPDGERRGTTNYLAHLAGVRWPGPGHEGTLVDALGDLVGRLDSEDGSLHRIDDVTAIAISALAPAAAGLRAA